MERVADDSPDAALRLIARIDDREAKLVAGSRFIYHWVDRNPQAAIRAITRTDAPQGRRPRLRGDLARPVAAEGGILLTKTLLISYLSKRGELGGRTPGTFLRAFDKATGGLVDVLASTGDRKGRPYGVCRAAVRLAVVSISGW